MLQDCTTECLFLVLEDTKLVSHQWWLLKHVRNELAIVQVLGQATYPGHPGQVVFEIGQVTFHGHLPNGQVSGQNPPSTK